MRAAAGAFLAMLVMTTACAPAQRRDLVPDEARLVAWWVEDVARTLPRPSTELATPNASAALQRIARWANARGDQLPVQLSGRQARWPAIRGLLAGGSLVIVEPGMLAVAPDADPAAAALAQPLADAENQDRRTIELILLSQSQADDRLARRLRDELRAARIDGDQAAGGRMVR